MFTELVGERPFDPPRSHRDGFVLTFSLGFDPPNPHRRSKNADPRHSIGFDWLRLRTLAQPPVCKPANRQLLPHEPLSTRNDTPPRDPTDPRHLPVIKTTPTPKKLRTISEKLTNELGAGYAHNPNGLPRRAMNHDYRLLYCHRLSSPRYDDGTHKYVKGDCFDSPPSHYIF